MSEVYKAINEVTKELATVGIGKDKRNQQQGYSFRGIDDVYNALAPVLAKHGLCVLPRMIARDCVERTTAKGNALFYVTVEAEFDLVSAADGSKHTVRTFGEAMDSADKATNKAMSAAYKYAAFQTFAIPTEATAEDADATTPEPVQPRKRTSVAAEAWEGITEPQRQKLMAIAMEIMEMWDHGSESAQEEATRFYIEKRADLDDQEQTALWSRFDSKMRRAIKEIGERLLPKVA